MAFASVETTARTARIKTKRKNPYSLHLRSRSLSPASLRKMAPNIPRAIVVCAFWVFVLGLYSFNAASRTKKLRGANVYHGSYRSSSGDLTTPPLRPLGVVISDVELFYMMPPSAQNVRGLLIFFHGCHHAGQDMFELPEDRIVALAALKRGLAVLSPTSQNRKSGCWSRQDLSVLEENQVVDKWLDSVGLPETLPRMGMGASSGGAFLFSVYKSLNLKSIAPYVSGKGFAQSELPSAPPTIYVHMTKDFKTADRVEEKYKALLKAGIPAEKVDVHPHPLTAELCAQRLPEFGDRRCQAFIKDVLARDANLLRKDDMTVLESYQSGDWTEAMEKAKLDEGLKSSSAPKKQGEAYHKNFGGHSWMWASMEEEIAAAFAVHEMTADHYREVLDFLTKHAGVEMPKKMRR